MKYDDASWHSDGDFPEDLPSEAGAIHIGIFVAWCQFNQLGGTLLSEDFPDELQKLIEHKVTPGAWLLSACDGKFTDEELSDEGNKFAEFYYELKTGNYIKDYERVLGGSGKTLYHVPDTWESYDKLAPVIASRYKNWKMPKKKWWFF